MLRKNEEGQIYEAGAPSLGLQNATGDLFLQLLPPSCTVHVSEQQGVHLQTYDLVY